MADSTHETILNECRDAIQALDLAMIGPRVHALWGLTRRDMELPAVVVTPNGTESVLGGTNASDYVRYPVAVLIVDRQGEDGSPPIGFIAAARQKIRQALTWGKDGTGADSAITRRLRALTDGTVFNGGVDPAPVVDVKAIEYQILASPLAFFFVSKEQRRAY